MDVRLRFAYPNQSWYMQTDSHPQRPHPPPHSHTVSCAFHGDIQPVQPNASSPYPNIPIPVQSPHATNEPR